MGAREQQPMGGLWALWFVVASLLAVLLIPAYLGQRVNEVQTRITDVAEEAASLSSRISLLKARQMARLESFILTGERTFREPYFAAKAEEDSLLEQLSLVGNDLDLDVRERLARLRFESTNWHLQNGRLFESESVGPAMLPDRTRGYEQLQAATRELDRAIQSEVAEGRRAVADVRTLQSRLTFGLALLALGATLVVGRVGFRLRSLGDEAEARRRDAVQARREIDSLLEATGDGVLGIDLDGKCTSLNRAGVELLGYGEGEIQGRDVHETLCHSVADGSPFPRESSPILAALAEGRTVESADGAVLWRRRGTSFPARWTLHPKMDGKDLRGAVLTFTDMTEIREKEVALRRAIRQREDVVSIVSHDLRNPLGVVLAASDILLDLPLDEEERRRQVEVIHRSGKRMQNLIEDLLDVARIEAGAFVVRPSLEQLVPLLEEARTLFHDQAERRGVSLRVETCPGEPRARIDRDRILQALANLLDNALRLTPEGGHIALGMGEGNGHVDLTVSDDGPGIDPDMLEHLFDRFAQSNSSGGRAGLGLAIVRGVAEAHSGSVSVVSSMGLGTTFTIRLPRAATPSSA